ncbi:uncharacterized protein B0I36DRAFT_425869 [Microdochium trichocladiopsis]|uniref:Rhodopsin domain-containing protein n=1 Tax=Microdochium trichocladiopsis TaxID=1682393 RepID=A0A9P8XVJ6_9PEZI|nr:uncharacterized protein B0I36DRAFT_425869 [Microdochium trichocladiopsis]KAH7014533.1 hypothetical protein B0I36DRAFT_425869 [Microdochium trichocladiopsis]
MGYIELSERDDSFLREVWGLYIFGMLILALRFVIRLKTVGIRGLKWDDLFALLVTVFYTIDAATVHIVYHAGSNVEGVFLESQRPLSDAELAQLEEGSKQQLLAWYSYSSLVWCLKGTMVCFFMRMTTGVANRKSVVWIGYACIVTYVAVELTITFGCWPYGGNFQVTPDPGTKCTLKPQNFIVMTVLNVLTDAAILSIPLPLLWTLQVPNRQKIVIGILLSSGVFVITAAIIRIVITLGSAPSALNINRWGVRETIVGIIAVNAPILRPLFSKAFWTGIPFSSGGGTKGVTTTGAGGTRSTAPHGPYELAPSVHSHSKHGNDYTGSEESIINKSPINSTHSAGVVGASVGGKQPTDGSVVVHTLYQVTEGPRSGNSSQWDQAGFHKATAYGGKSPV